MDHSINCIIQDHIGFMWIGGSDGLYRYDGYEFINYQYQNGGKTNQYFREVYKIKEDKNGLLWILSESGIIVFNPERNKSILLFPYLNEIKSDEFNYIPDIIIDSDDNIWATYRKGVMKISQTDNLKEFIEIGKVSENEEDYPFKSELIELPFLNREYSNLVTKIYEDQDNNILIGCVSGLYKYDKNSNTITTLAEGIQKDPENGMDYIRAIVQTEDDSYWIAAGNFLYNLKRTNSKQIGTTNNITSRRIVKHLIRENQIPTSLYVDRRNDIFVGTVQGIYKLVNVNNKENITFIYLDSTKNDPEYYGYAKTIRDIFKDRSGVIWTAQDYYGITKFKEDGSQFNTYKNLIIENFRSTDINPLFKDDNGDLWVGTYGGGAYKIQKNTYKVTNYSMYKQKNDVICMQEITPGKFWVGSTLGLTVLDAKKGQAGPPPSALKIINQKEILIWDILKKDTLLFIASLEGLFVFDLKTKKLLQYPYMRSDLLSGGENQIFSLLGMRNGEILAGTSSLGLIKIIYTDSGFGFTSVADNKILADKGIKLDRRHRLFEDSDGIIWIVDYTGLHKLNIKTLEITNYRLIEGVNLPIAWSITEDNYGRLWIGTHYGLCCFDKTTGEVKVYDKGNGLPVIIHGLNSVYNDYDGRLYFGGIGGFYDFYPDSLIVNAIVPPVVITEILLSDKSLKEDTSATSFNRSDIPYIKTLKLKYYQNNLTIKFSALDYTQPSENQYLYNLKGFQDQWIKADANSRIVNYMELEPGNYVFTVKGSNNDGIWNEEGSSLNIIIQKPWWTTYLAWTIYFIIILLGIIGIFRWRLYRLRREREELEDLVNIRTLEIKEQSRKISEQKDLLEQQNRKIREEEELKTRFFSNISHEFRTPLSLIMSPAAELLTETRMKEKDRRKVGMIERNAQRLLNLVNQLLDLSKYDENKMTLEICESDIMKHLKNITASFISAAEAKSIDYQCIFNNERVITWFDPDKTEKIATNLLSNAFKFTPVGGEIEFRAEYIYDKNTDTPIALEFSIKDNGSGIPEQSLGKIFNRFYQVEELSKTDNLGTGIGLSLSKDLARLMHGDITVKSKLGEGSIFIVRIPLGKNHLKENEYVILNYQPDDEKSIGALNNEYFNSETGEKDFTTEEEGKPAVLIVDDNRDLRDQLRENLESIYNISLAVDGVAGLKKALEIIPDLIITDLMMPNMDGMELCKELKENENTSHVPIIMLTAKDTIEDKISGLQTGADDYIPKPFDMSELKARIANLIGQRNKLRERFSREITLEPADIAITSEDETFLNKAVSLIEAHLKDEGFTLEYFRQGMNMSRSTLFRRLSDLTGQSPTEFIRTIRLKRAATLLRQNFGNVSQVALEVGFNNISYFNRSFKKLYGVSPKEFAGKDML